MLPQQSHLPPPLPPKNRQRGNQGQIAIQNNSASQLPELIMNYSQSSIVNQFLPTEENQFSRTIDEAIAAEEEMQQLAALGKNAYMPQPLNQLWNLEQNRPLAESNTNLTRQPEFESVNNANSSGGGPSQMLPHSGAARPVFNDSGFSDQGGGPNKIGPAAPAGHSQKHPIPEEQWQNIVDWVNSFNDPSCLLVSGFEDFRDGIALCHLVAMITCNAQDQAQMSQLIHHEHDCDPVKMRQNVELALNVLVASSVAIPDAIQKMTAADVQDSEVHCFMFLETLRQAKNLGIIQLLEQASPIKPARNQNHEIYDNSAVVEENNNVLQQSPLELESTQKILGAQASHNLNQEIDSKVRFDQQAAFQVNRSVHEVVHIDTTTEKPSELDVVEKLSNNEDVQINKNNANDDQEYEDADNNDLVNEQNLSPTFQPDKLQQMREQLPLQMDSASKKSQQSLTTSYLATPLGTISKREDSKAKKQQPSGSNNVSSEVASQSQQKNRSISNSQTNQSSQNVVEDRQKRFKQKPPAALAEYSNQKNVAERSQNSRSRSRTEHKQDSNYKPLFTDSVNQRKKLQELQLQIQNYDNVIRNSYERLSANKQQLEDQQSLHRPASSLKNADLTDVARNDIALLDQQILYEQEIDRLLPFQQADSGSRQQTAQQRMKVYDGGCSPPRMDSPTNRQQHNTKAPGQRRHPQFQVAERGSKPEMNNRRGGPQQQVGDDIEQIMEQMQTLNIERKEVEIQPVDEKTKFRLIRWLIDDVKLISNMVNPVKLIQDLPKYCRNGVLFGDLVNRLRGRDEVIKGLHRAPKNMTAINANFEKVLGYLKEFPRFSSRYLWSQQKVVEGNTDVVWGLLDDIWHWHFNKISATDPAQLPKTASEQQIHAASKNNLTTSSMNKSKQMDHFGTGPPKMRDYLKNGERAASGLRLSSQGIATVSGKQDNCSPRAKKRRQERQVASALDQHHHHSEEKSQQLLQHNFNPSKRNKPHSPERQDLQFLNSRQQRSLPSQQPQQSQENYHSFGMIQQHQSSCGSGEQIPNQQQQKMQMPQQMQYASNQSSPQQNNNNLARKTHYQSQFNSANRLDKENLMMMNTVAQSQLQTQPQQIAATSAQTVSAATMPPSRPPKPPHLANLSNLSSALKQKQQMLAFEAVPRLNCLPNAANLGNVSARSHYSRNDNVASGMYAAKKYAVIESHKSQTSASRNQNQPPQQRKSLSQFESPRNYAGAFRSARQQQNSALQANQSSASAFQNNHRVTQSERNNSNLSHYGQQQQRSASRKKVVHMRTSQDFYQDQQSLQTGSKQINQQNQSTMPFALAQQLVSSNQKGSGAGVMFRSMDSLSSYQAATAPQKFTPKAGSDPEQTVTDWLHFLKFHPFMSAEFEYVSLTEDPQRNGIFIAELVSYLLPQNAMARSLSEGPLIKQRPKSVVDCQKNWSNIFSVLYQLFLGQSQSQQQYGNTRFLSKQMMQALMQGDRNYLYRLLYSIYQTFYEPTTISQQQQMSVEIINNLPVNNSASACGHSSLGGSTTQAGGNQTVAPLMAPVEIMQARRRMTPSHSASSMQQVMTGGVGAAVHELELPYTPDELTQLDLSIIQWLKEIGQLKALSIDFEKVDSVLDLQDVIRNGVLLCALVSRVFKVRITGVFKSPKTETTCLSNIRKAMKVLQTARKMSQKFTWTEKQVFECQRSIILGLLEDIHRAFDGLPPRKRGNTYFDDGPYCGTRFQEQYKQHLISTSLGHQQQSQTISLDECHQESITQQRFSNQH